MKIPKDIVKEVQAAYVETATTSSTPVKKSVKAIADMLLGIKVELTSPVVCFDTHQDSDSPVQFLKLVFHEGRLHIANKAYTGVYTYAMIARQAAQHLQYDGVTKQWSIPAGKVLEVARKLEKGGVFIKIWDKAQLNIDLDNTSEVVVYSEKVTK